MPASILTSRSPRPTTCSNKTRTMKRGDVYWADLAPRSGSEQQGRRPVIVISHDAFNQTQGWRSIIVVPLSTSWRKLGAGLLLCCCHKAQQVQAKTVLRSVISDHSGSLEAHPTNWRIKFNRVEPDRRRSQGCDGLAVRVFVDYEGKLSDPYDE